MMVTMNCHSLHGELEIFILKKNLTGRIRTIDLGITIEDIYSPPLYQLSYGELDICGVDDTNL